MSTSPLVWPRLYLLRLYNEAIEHGHVVVHPITEEAAASLKATFYRLRRRSDKANASFILPEYHLVTVGQWTEDRGGSLHIIYSSVPDYDLPAITPCAEPATEYLPPSAPVVEQVLGLDHTGEILTEVADLDITSFIENMRAKAAAKGEEQ